MKGTVVSAIGGTYDAVDNLEKPVPGPGQVLVKSLYSGLNPVETYMQASGVMVTAWPIVLGCDASGTIVEVGENVTKFKVGDGIYGCTRLGIPGYGTFQEFHLMDENLAFKKPENITAEQAATLGVGLDTASLGLYAGLKIALPETSAPPAGEEWLVILGGSGIVGQFATKLATLSGYKVIAGSSSAKAAFCTAAGASATIDYKLPLPEQVAKISEITGGKFAGLMDASASSYASAIEILVNASTVTNGKCFSSTDDWSPMTAPEGSGIEIHRIRLGQIGRFGEGKEAIAYGEQKDMEATHDELVKAIPIMEKLVAEGKVKAMEYEVVGKGFESVGDSVKISDSGKLGGKKGLVKITEE